ncbi:MAG: exonuclease domain-containing protein [Clostridiales bacterium]|nr:exonuclease domain-containing protein [Clostridiales bacterium]
MIHIFVDFEMNSIAKELFDEFQDCHMEIIEIGAVAIDDSMQEIGSYKRYIKPQYNEHIMPRYVELTGISDETVADAADFEECFFDFLKWCGSFAGKNGYEIYAWSKSDLDQIKRELKLKKINKNKPSVKWMLSHWYDYQKEYCGMLGLSHPISLDRAISSLEQEFSGKMHDALCDARNTARLYKIAHDKKSFEKIFKPLKETINQEPTLTCEIGEILNFDVLNNLDVAE